MLVNARQSAELAARRISWADAAAAAFSGLTLEQVSLARQEIESVLVVWQQARR